MADLKTELFTKVLPNMNALTQKTEPLDNLKFDDEPGTAKVITVDAPLPSKEPPNKTQIILRFYDSTLVPATVRECSKATGLDVGDCSTRVTQLCKRGLLVAHSYNTRGTTLFKRTDVMHVPMDMKVSAEKARAAWVAKAKAARMESKPTKNKAARPKGPAFKPKYPMEMSKPTTLTIMGIDINQLPLAQARALYDQLKQIFGG